MTMRKGISKRIKLALGRRFGKSALRLLGPELRAEVIERAGDELIVETEIPGGSIRFFAPSPELIDRAEAVLSKETDTIDWIDGFDDNSVFWDIGANVGVYSLYAAIRKQARALAFEPSAPNFYALARNVQLNDLCDRVATYCLAFAERTQLGTLNLASHWLGTAMNQFAASSSVVDFAESPRSQDRHGMLGFSIDDFIELFDPPFPNHIKIDVDGIESSILKGASATLRDPRLKSLIVELNVCHATEGGDALSFLKELGFCLVSQGAIQITYAEQTSNHLFERDVRGMVNRHSVTQLS